MEQQSKWYKTILTPQTFLYAMGAIVATVIFWYRTQESWAKGKEVEDKVNRQYQVQREMNERIQQEIKVILLWIEFEKGRQQSLK